MAVGCIAHLWQTTWRRAIRPDGSRVFPLQKEATPGGGRGGKGLTQGKQPTGGRGSDTEPKPNSPLRFLDLTPKILRQPLTLVRMMIVALRLCLVSMETAKQLIIVKSAEFKLSYLDI
jgi:hypothetical protein